MAPSKKSSQKNKNEIKLHDKTKSKKIERSGSNSKTSTKQKSSAECSKKMDFCARLCGRMMLSAYQENSEVNIVLSPLSFHAILNMIASGATGRTLEQLLSFLDCKDIDDLKAKFSEMMDMACNNEDGDGPVIAMANGVWVDRKYPLTDSYAKFVKRFCKAEARNVDFTTQADEVVDEANLWAKTETKGLVTDVLGEEDVSPSTICLLGNALYFKGAWCEKFDANRTQKKDFYLINGEKVSADFMTGCEDYLYGSFSSFQVVKIPYRMGGDENKKLEMYILLPHEKDGLGALLQKVDSDPNFLGQTFKLENEELDIFWIPKFKFSYKTYKGRETMMNLGLKLPFNPNCRELTEMVNINSEVSFGFSRVIQKAFIEVDEEGTEASAVTFASEEEGCAEFTEFTEFVADHPFLFLIREETSRCVLFTGTVLNPCSS